MKFVIFIVLSAFFSQSISSQSQFSVYFDSNKYELTNIEISKLNQWLIENSNSKVVGIHGFCDEDGTNAFNDTLAKNRINFVFNSIKEKIKIREDFKTRNFGELHKLSKVKAENRKVSLFYLEEKDLGCENEILGNKEPDTLIVPKPHHYPEKVVFENPNGTTSEFKLDTIFMKKMAETPVGKKVQIENLNFHINTYIVIPDSKGKMYELLLVMESNPNLKIEIQGHLCCMPIDRLDLSTQRAKAINKFLIANGINENRITYKGFGSSQPIYPLPEKDETQRVANRRVEILIVANKK